MDEDVSFRAIMIGAGLLIAITTISLVITYYNTAKSVATAVGTGVDYNIKYRNDIEKTLLKTDNISATEVINLIYYFQNNDSYEIDLKEIKVLGNNGKISSTLMNYLNINHKTSNEIATAINNICKTATFKLSKESSEEKTTVIIKQK